MSRSSHRRMRSVTETDNQQDPMTEAEKIFSSPTNNDTDQEELLTLIQERESLDRKISMLKAEQRRTALNQIHTLIQLHGFTPHDLFSSSISQRKPKAKAAPKFRDPASGQMWSGRGKPPRWYALAEDKESLLIANQSQ